MPSEKVTRILLSKTDLAIEEIAGLSESEAWAVIYALPTKRPRKKAPELCLTGFRKSEKEELRVLAARAGYTVVTNVTANLAVLVAGENAGPSKLQRAEAQGARILTAAELRGEAAEA